MTPDRPSQQALFLAGCCRRAWCCSQSTTAADNAMRWSAKLWSLSRVMLLTFPLRWARIASASALFAAPPPCVAPITSAGVRRQRRRQGQQIPVVGMALDFFRQMRRVGAGQAVAEIVADLRDGRGTRFGMGAQVLAVGAHVPRIDQHHPRHVRVCRRIARRREAAHAMAADQDAVRIDAILRGVLGLAQEGHRRFGILDRAGEAESAGRAPTAAIVHRQHIPAGAPDRLRQVEILLVAGQAVQQQQRRLGTARRPPGRTARSCRRRRSGSAPGGWRPDAWHRAQCPPRRRAAPVRWPPARRQKTAAMPPPRV